MEVIRAKNVSAKSAKSQFGTIPHCQVSRFQRLQNVTVSCNARESSSLSHSWNRDASWKHQRCWLLRQM